ncbi:MAG: fluoride efflux transporter CrcB [Pseudomonadota bacterium]
MQIYLAVAAGGALGALGRYGVGKLAMHWLGAGYPWGTLAVNVAGGLMMGILAELSALLWSQGLALRAFLTVGLLGGFTTFSAFSLEMALMLERGEAAAALLYALASVGLSLAALFLGLLLVRWGLAG